MSHLPKPDFYLMFNRRQGWKQWAHVYLWDVHPNTFSNWDAGRWGYFERGHDTSPSAGYFGDLHFVKSRLRIDTIYHELDHMRQEWVWANRLAWSTYSEERLISFMDTCLWNFLRELSKHDPRARVWMKTLSEL